MTALHGTIFILLARCSVIAAPPELSTQVILDKPFYAAGDTIVAAFRVVIPERFHLYSNPLGPGIGKPLRLSVACDSGVRWLAARKPPPMRFYPEIGDWVWVYQKSACFFFQGVIERGFSPVVDGRVVLNGLICASSCLPVSVRTDFRVNVSNHPSAAGFFDSQPALRSAWANATAVDFDTVAGKEEMRREAEPLGRISFAIESGPSEEKPYPWDYQPTEKKISMNLFLAILFGFLAGIILNVMPCVLPVLGIKILSFAKVGGSSRKTVFLRSLAFAGGMISVFMALAALASFAHLSWGQQFQSPWFLVSLVVLTVIFALGLFDVYVIALPGAIAGMERMGGRGFFGEIVRGMFATLLATPCSGPFLGATLAWTLTQPSVIIFLVFASIGVGMAFPYVVFSASRTLIRLIPKPGKWMEDFKHLTGILLLGAVVYFLFGLPKDMVVSTVGFSISVVFAVVFFVRYAPFGSRLWRYAVAAVVGLTVVGTGFYLSFGVIYRQESARTSIAADTDIPWEDFSPKRLLGAHATGRNAIVDFTANWCLNCQYNFLTVLSTPEVAALIRRKNVLPLKADLTWTNIQTEALLHDLGSRSVPFLAVFPGDDPYHPIIMRDILSKRALLKVLRKLPEK